MQKFKVSIIFRALNEAEWFEDAIIACKNQEVPDEVETEIILVDSGSTDGTLEIAAKHALRVTHIKKSEFTFGRSLNLGCDAAIGDILVFISAHCIPEHPRWMTNLIQPLVDGRCAYTYGRQVGHKTESRFSEREVFAHYYGAEDHTPQDGFFCNNANSAILRSAWARHRFDESVTGLEDMVLAKTLHQSGEFIGYVANAPVVHIHDEDLQQTYKRYFREALVMRDILPSIHFNFLDLASCIATGVAHDLATAARARRLWKEAIGIFGFRFMQYWGTYRGHNEHRSLSRAEKESYYYPRIRQRLRKKKQTRVASGQSSAGRTNPAE